jgi:hypothetical protein
MKQNAICNTQDMNPETCHPETQNEFFTPHFALNEFTKSATARKYAIANIPTPEDKDNLRSLCVNALEPLREEIDLPVCITSGFRCKALNERITHHSNTSQHMSGRAADFHIGDAQGSSGLSHRERLIKAFRLIITSDKIDYDQVILYPTFIHVSYVSRDKNRHCITKANGHGHYCNLTRAQALAIL